MLEPPRIAPKTAQLKVTKPSGAGVFVRKYESGEEDGQGHWAQTSSGHRPIKSCTFCRQHKLKCDAAERAPRRCHRCEKMDLACEIDPEFRPKKGSQIQSLRDDVDQLKTQLETLQEKNEGLLSQMSTGTAPVPYLVPMIRRVSGTAETFLKSAPSLYSPRQAPFTDAVSEPPLVEKGTSETVSFSEYVLGDVHLLAETATRLHRKFIDDYLPFLPILTSNSPAELYQQSQLLFWTVILTACLSEPDPSIYQSLAPLIKQLAIETCWIRTPRSTHIIQALVILSFWPLPNEKVLDDVAYRFVGLAKNLSLQLGLHRGKFISEFSRTQVALPNAEKWRTRSWLLVFFAEQFWSSNLGLPPLLETDYLLETARIDYELPKTFRCLISLAIFQSKLVSMMGSSVTSPDGLMESKNRSGMLLILDRELERLAFKLQIDTPAVEIYFLYVKLMICCFAFLPGTPIEDQTKYVTDAYLASTRIVTLVSKMIEVRQLIELPMYVRHPVSFAVMLLFRLHLTELLEEKYVDSARQSIVTVHRLYRNMLSAWKDTQNDISRTASVLEKLNYVIITCPELFTSHTEGIISRMRSHLTGSLFYDLIWCIHEARRRSLLGAPVAPAPNQRRPPPLPFYNQITKDDFTAFTQTTPGGTTVTTLVPTHQALSQATNKATAAGLAKPIEINGIPLALLEATGSTLKGGPPGGSAKPTAKTSVHATGVYPVVSSPGLSVLLQTEPTPAVRTPPATRDLSEYPPVSLFSQPSSSTNLNHLGQIDVFSGVGRQGPDQFEDFFQQQTMATWNENGDDFLGWFDNSSLGPEF